MISTAIKNLDAAYERGYEAVLTRLKPGPHKLSGLFFPGESPDSETVVSVSFTDVELGIRVELDNNILSVNLDHEKFPRVSDLRAEAQADGTAKLVVETPGEDHHASVSLIYSLVQSSHKSIGFLFCEQRKLLLL